MKADEHSQHAFLKFFKQHTGSFPPQVCSGSKIHCAVWANSLLKSDHNKMGSNYQCVKKFDQHYTKSFFIIHLKLLYWWGGIKPWNISGADKSVIVVKNYSFY